MNKVKILCTNYDQYGVGYWRTTQPHIFLQENYPDDFHIDLVPVFDFNNIPKLMEYQIIFCHRGLTQNYDEQERLFNLCKQLGIKVVLDIDDDWVIPHFHPLFHLSRIEKIDQKIINNLRMADYITTTTSIFANKISTINKNVIVFPNAVNPNEKQFKPNPIKSDKIRIGFLGGSSHWEDIQQLRGVAAMLEGDGLFSKAQIVLCGFDIRGFKKIINPQTKEEQTLPIEPKESVWYEYQKLFTDNMNIIKDIKYKEYLDKFIQDKYPGEENQPFRRLWTKPVRSYAEMYNSFDILLAPIVNNRFNIHKSNLKIVEAGFHKKAIICSNIGPYTIDTKNGENCILIDEKRAHKDWYKSIKKLIQNPDMIKTLGENLYETVKDKYNLINVSKERAEFYKSIV